MTDGLDITILRGGATEREAAAVRAAFEALAREARAEALAAAGVDGWRLAARLEGARGGLDVVRTRAGRDAWRASGRFGSPESHIQTGRGDAR